MRGKKQCIDFYVFNFLVYFISFLLRYKSVLLSMADSVLKKIQLHHNMDELQDIDDDTINDVSRVISCDSHVTCSLTSILILSIG